MQERDVGHRQNLEPQNAFQTLFGDHPVAEVFDPVTVIGARQRRDRLLDCIKGHIHRAIAYGVNADPVSSLVIGVDCRIEFFGRDADEAAVAGIVRIGL